VQPTRLRLAVETKLMNAPQAAHPTDQTLHACSLGQLDDALAESVNQHLEGCPDCRRRVVELSSDSFLGRLRDAKALPASQGYAVSAPDGLSMLDGGAIMAKPPLASTLPAGLADHPNYQILRELGRGGMGVVYLAENTLMGRKEVLKVVGSHLVSRPMVLDRFRREIRSAAQLHHTNIVTAYTALTLGETFVLAMEYVEGFDLARVVKGNGPLPVAHACNYVHQAALGLQHAHEHGMVHRDIKPSNLMLSRQGKRPVMKVLDFGLAKVRSEGQTDSGLTREGQMLGTPDYIAPEQIRDAQSADIRADIYSLGCTIYHLLAGRPPFTGDNLWDLYQAHFSMVASPLNMARPEVPAELAALVAKMMAKDPARRFQEPREVAQALTPFFRPAMVQPSDPGGKPSRTPSPVGPAQPTGVGPVRDQPSMIGPPPLPLAAESSKTGVDGVEWKSLIELQENEPSIASATPKFAEANPSPADVPVRRRPPWLLPTVAVASLFGLITLGYIVGLEMNRIVVPDDDTVASPAEVERAPQYVIGSEWTVEGGELINSGVGDYDVGFGDPDWTDYDLCFKARTSAGSRTVGAHFRVDPANDNSLYALILGSERYTLGRWSMSGGIAPDIESKPGAIQPDQWYQVKISLRSTHISIIIDDHLYFDVDDTFSNKGFVALKCWGSDGRFRDIEIRAPNGTVLWKGPPDLP
jgi:serine/threonine protein kinase